MSNEIETSLEAQEAELLQQAQQADIMGVSPDELDSISENKQELADPVEETNEEGQDTETDNNVLEDDAGESDNTETSDNSDDDTQVAESSDNKNVEPSKPTKQQKEDERRDRSWKKLEEEKARFAREKAEWETLKANSQSQANKTPISQDPNALAKAFDDIALQFEEAGDFDKADEARKRAEELRSNPQATQQQMQSQNTSANNQQFQVAWSANIERAMADFPEMKDPNSDFGRNVQALLRAPDSAQFFNSRPDGIYVAAQLTHLKMTASRVPALEKENASLKEQIKQLRQGMGLPSTGSRNRAGESTPFDSLSLAEQEKILLKQASEADRTGVPMI